MLITNQGKKCKIYSYTRRQARPSNRRIIGWAKARQKEMVTVMKKRHGIAVVAAICLLALFFVTGCGKKAKYEDLILGTWCSSGKDVITFYSDGTCDIAGDYGFGKWRITNDNHLEFDDFYGQSVFNGTIDSLDESTLTLTRENGTQYTLEKKQGDSATSGDEAERESYENKLLGTWYIGDEKAVVFYSDGTCDVIYEYGLCSWAIVNDNQLKCTNIYGEQVFLGPITNIGSTTFEITAEDGTTYSMTKSVDDKSSSGSEAERQKYENTLLGAWYADGEEVFFLYSDGTCSAKDQPCLGKWAVVNNGLFKYTSLFNDDFFVGTIDKLDANSFVSTREGGEALAFSSEESETFALTRAAGFTPQVFSIFTQEDYFSEMAGTWYYEDGNLFCTLSPDGSCNKWGRYWTVSNGNIFRIISSWGAEKYTATIEDLSDTELTLVSIDDATQLKLVRAVENSGSASSTGAETAANAGTAEVKISSSTFPDEAFRSYVSSNFDKDGDGILSAAEIADITEISLSDYENSISIESLAGIEYFSELTGLDCGYISVANLNLSNNKKLSYLQCSELGDIKLDISGCTALTYLECSATYMDELDVSGCPNLEHLSCGQCDLTKLDLRNNTKLEYLDCTNNLISDLDLSNNPALTTVNCSSEALKTLNISNNPLLTDLTFNAGITVICGTYTIKDAVQVSSLNFPDEEFRAYVSKNFDANSDGILSREEIANVKSIDVAYHSEGDEEGWGRITSLWGIEYLTSLEHLECYYNEITYLNLSQNTKLKYLSCSDNFMTELDLSNNPELEYLSCEDTPLESLDVSHNNKLTRIDCYRCSLAILTLGSQPVLTILDCGENSLSALDVSKAPALEKLGCYYNNLTSLDVSQNTKLYELECSDNQIKSLDLTHNPALTDLYCDDNVVVTR